MTYETKYWIDGRFLSSSENPDKLDKYIRRYEHARIVNLICLVIILVLLIVVVVSGGGINDNTFLFIYIMFVFGLVLLVQADIYTKVLKLQRQQQKRDTKDEKTPSGIGKKSSISEMALIYGSVLVTGILGILIYMFYVMDT